MDKDSCITDTVVSLYTYSGGNYKAWASRAELQNYTLVNSDTEMASTFPDSLKFRQLLGGKVDKA